MHEDFRFKIKTVSFEDIELYLIYSKYKINKEWKQN